MGLSLYVGHPYENGRECTTCGEFKPISEFYLEKDIRAVGGIAVRSKCSPCTEFRKYKAFIKKTYGITYEEYLTLLEEQNFGCAICESKIANNSRTSNKLFIDHCHITNKVRGLLCHSCNFALGYFHDDVNLLQKATDYLNKYKDYK